MLVDLGDWDHNRLELELHHRYSVLVYLWSPTWLSAAGCPSGSCTKRQSLISPPTGMPSQTRMQFCRVRNHCRPNRSPSWWLVLSRTWQALPDYLYLIQVSFHGCWLMSLSQHAISIMIPRPVLLFLLSAWINLNSQGSDSQSRPIQTRLSLVHPLLLNTARVLCHISGWHYRLW